MNRKQWWALSGIFLVLNIGLMPQYMSFGALAMNNDAILIVDRMWALAIGYNFALIVFSGIAGLLEEK